MTAVPETKGLWWKSFVAAWIGSRVVGLVLVLFGLDEVPDVVDAAAFLGVWALTWAIWRRHLARDAGHPQGLAAGPFGVMRRLFLAFVGAVLAIGYTVVVLDATAELDRTDVPVGVVAGSLTVLGLLSFAGGRIWVPRLDGSDPIQLVTSYRSRLVARLAWAEVPAILALGAFILLGGEAWVSGVGIGASLVGLALVAPTRSSLRRDQERLRAAGHDVDLFEIMGLV